tara:strand:- start:398 stop:931 length:534 start_codon:yes stop_codon:yes gene_type:complete
MNDTVDRPGTIDAILLNDCWGEDWIRSEGVIGALEFYGRIIDFFEGHKILQDKSVGYKSLMFSNTKHHSWGLHHWFKDRYNIVEVSEPEHLRGYLRKGDNLLVTGASWKVCLHESQFSFSELQKVNMTVWSHPNLVNVTGFKEPIPPRVTDIDFKKDGWEKMENKWPYFGLWRLPNA